MTRFEAFRVNIVGMLVTIASCEFSNRMKGNNLFIDDRQISVKLRRVFVSSSFQKFVTNTT